MIARRVVDKVNSKGCDRTGWAATMVNLRKIAAEKTRAGKNSWWTPTLQPLFLPAPPERKSFLLCRPARREQPKFKVRIFVKKSPDFNKKVPQTRRGGKLAVYKLAVYFSSMLEFAFLSKKCSC